MKGALRMGKIWVVMVAVSALLAIAGGRAGEASAALLDSGNQAVKLLFTLLGSMTLWSGLMEILDEAGDAARLGRVYRRLLKPLFPGLHDDEAWNAMSLNLSANLLGLGNAATPAGIAAARRLAALGDEGLHALAMLLVLDNTSLQLIPATVMTMRQAAGAKDPGDIWGMTLLISGVAMIAGALLMKMICSGGKHGKYVRCSDRRDHRPDHPAGMDGGM